MLKLRKHSRTLTLTAATVVATLALSLGTAGTASAEENLGSGGCRSNYTPNHQWAQEPGNVQVDVCAWVPNIYNNSIQAEVTVIASGSVSVDPCAQLLRANADNVTYTVVHDYGCAGWQPLGWSLWDSQGYDPHDYGEYYVRTGFWAWINNTYGYYGNVQSPGVQITVP